VARARATKAQRSEDLWHLSIDDLFASTIVPTSGPISGPFVINLSLSSVPSGAMPRGMPRFEQLCVYQLQRPLDERREEFRLRIGVIETELEADAILAAVREHYPAARKETASEEDSRAVALRKAHAAQRAAAAKRVEPKSPKKPPAVAPTRDVMLRSKDAAAAPAAAPYPWNVDDVLPQFAGFAAVKCAPVKRGPATPVAPIAPPAETIVVAEAVAAEAPPPAARLRSHNDLDADPNAVTTEVETLTFTIEAPISAVAPRPEPEITFEMAAPAGASEPESLEITVESPVPESAPPLAMLEITVEAPAPQLDVIVEAPHISDVPVLEAAPPDAPATERAFEIDSSQTLRALTPLELADDDGAACFVVQLVLSEHEIDPDQVPSLGIFSEYRLYRIKGLHQDNVMHALRLGFFGSEPAAQAVAGYLAVFFDAPTITRVNTAERERFSHDHVKARKDIGETGSHSIIELTSPTPLPKRAEREVPPQDKVAHKGSLWSRLLAPLKR
jgi:hypothetical protein